MSDNQTAILIICIYYLSQAVIVDDYINKVKPEKAADDFD
ncbi:hypothetical protein YPPY66_1572 [Yersinia pestis PY-66]|uniref:Uncharacterized protein n=2 Tax=Yersinia pseudotuberculosis complex TaxID=1649845 RepID=A0A0U1QYM3_YERP3|nr:hypothetical protein YpsIP31758_2827 [Yersinia pseudotuberculosis IP 31758]ADV97879.1 hypothetical protein YPC_1229 [Yersinia pestis biovar Medievalis str. Harbin 35]EDR40533.1 hypothetical protein YpF1991016_0523 [Yersinia pestis biovar Orientalis str. F1991016]EDR41840.1 hypothetical protein YpE1979001_4042 [Yersinia pestis biovar Antiqua str. E1979001]EDR51689.1 hypothetical protein YpB42003004_2148 [Yersinia pestis biovar Antiqua str. B42003004]EDR61567.1 hypothetical protein YpUG050454